MRPVWRADEEPNNHALALYRIVWRSVGGLNFFDAPPPSAHGQDPTPKLPIRATIPSLSLATNSLRCANWTLGGSVVLIASDNAIVKTIRSMKRERVKDRARLRLFFDFFLSSVARIFAI